MMRERVFVYGTLRRGGSNHALIRHAPLLGECVTAPAYQMLDLGPFPGVVMPGEQAIVGEVYRVSPSMLRELDRLEDVPRLYRRERMDSPWGVSWIYIYRSSMVPAPLVPGGDWMRYRSRAGGSRRRRPG
ncbi:MAG: gamma-glutamylcyclotransferase [Ectothiorhodospiraceae bacterium]|nr:gamma-glutamylcyclotransferase [Ectothiorhodospiraceae bacterium]